MSNALARVVGKADEEVSSAVAALERKFGYPSADVRLLGEIAHQVKQKIARLGLDPDDTTPKELYHALLARFDYDSGQIDRALGIAPQTTFDQRVSKAIELLYHIQNMGEVWALKSSPSKNLLRLVKPKKLMKQLNYRSVDSMLKHESQSELLLALPFVESATWQNSFAKRTKLSGSVDYELRTPTVVKLPAQRWQKVKGPLSHVATSKISASIAIWPDQQMLKARTLHLVLVLMDGLKELGLSSEIKSIMHIHPVLNFWAGMEHLVSHDGRGVVSLNIKDVAANHLNGSSHAEAVTRSGGQSLWTELMARYHQQVPSILPELEYQINKLSAPMPSELALEHVNAE